MKRGINKKIILIPIVVIVTILVVNGSCLKNQTRKRVECNTEVSNKKEVNLKYCNVAREETIPEVFAIGVNGKYEPGYDSGNEGEYK